MERGGSFSGFSEYKSSPFRVEGVVDKWVDAKPVLSGYVYHTETGEVPLLMPSKRVYVKADSMTYVKMLKNREVEVLSGKAKLVLMYVAYHLRIRSKEIQLRWMVVKKWCGISKGSFYAGVKELLEKGVLALKDAGRSDFWVNPNYVFNGDRTKAGFFAEESNMGAKKEGKGVDAIKFTEILRKAKNGAKYDEAELKAMGFNSKQITMVLKATA